MHAIQRVISPRYSQSSGFPLMALIKAVLCGSGREESKNDFPNNLIITIPLSTYFFSLPHSFCPSLFPQPPPKPCLAHIYSCTHLLFSKDTVTQVALSFLSLPPTSTCSLADQRAAKVPKSNLATIQDAPYSVNYHHNRTTVSQPVQDGVR